MWLCFSLILTIILLGSDQVLKFWVASNVAPGIIKSFVPGLSLTNVKNSGAAWNLLTGQRWLLIIIAITALVVIGYYCYQCRADACYELALAFLLSGTIGNLINRVVNGQVIDMFQTTLINFPVFNLADCDLTIGVIWLMALIITNRRPIRNRGSR